MQDVANGKTALNEKNDKAKSRSIVTGGKGIATRTVGLLGGIMSYAIKLGLRTDNPVKGVERFKDKKNERYLTNEELTRLGKIFNQLEKSNGESIFAINALRLLILTGARKSEILNAKWQHYDKDNSLLYLSDSKTGARFYNLGAAATDLLDTMPRVEGSPFIVPGKLGAKPFVGLQKVWERIRAMVNLEDVPIHSLRHGFAAAAANSNTSLLLIGKILGHKNQATTMRYAHLTNDPVRSAANKTAEHLAKFLK